MGAAAATTAPRQFAELGLQLAPPALCPPLWGRVGAGPLPWVGVVSECMQPRCNTTLWARALS